MAQYYNISKITTNFFTQKIYMKDIMASFSYIVIILLLFSYILGKIFNLDYLNRIFDDIDNYSLIYILIIFVLLSNFDKIREIIKSIVREKMDSIIISDIRSKLKHEFENDPELLDKLTIERNKKINESFNETENNS